MRTFRRCAGFVLQLVMNVSVKILRKVEAPGIKISSSSSFSPPLIFAIVPVAAHRANMKTRQFLAKCKSHLQVKVSAGTWVTNTNAMVTNYRPSSADVSVS